MPFKGIAEIPAHYHSRKQVYENCEIVPFTAYLQIGDIGNPHQVGGGHGELAVQQIGSHWLSVL
ncbi:hypothetical protein DGMP_26070 [Desulfomarina profundi]|uniref:Uncharacterized protein n=1 Tax=Desulfomarina profundi TaxID=2772557 RepID=A0A8D5FUG4_9BACT|nr:hypothetical protein DGMP_26070 [Desulfomarina profundi]